MIRLVRLLALLGLSGTPLVSGCSCDDEPTSPKPLPGAVGTFTATARSSGRIDLSWSASTDTGEYRIDRSVGNPNSFQPLIVVPAPGTAHADTGLIAGTTYYYRITPAGQGLGPTFSPPASATTPLQSWSNPPIPATVGVFGHAAVYDPVGRRMLVFGGSTLITDVLALDLTQPAPGPWTTLAVLGSPPAARIGHSMVYDPDRRWVIVFGGDDGSGASTLQDAHALQLNLVTPTWTALPAGPFRAFHSAVYDLNRHRMVVYAGVDENLAVTGDAWVFDPLLIPSPSSWSTIAPNPAVGRADAAATYIAQNSDALFLSGRDDGGATLPGIFALASPSNLWSASKYNPGPPIPPERLAHTAIFDELSGRVWMFGGADFALVTYSEVWRLELGGGTPAWSSPSPGGTPPPARFRHTAIYDSFHGRMIIFGGDDGTFFAPMADVWILTL